MTDFLCCVLPFVAILGGGGLVVLLWRLWAMCGFEASVAMDGATCLRAADGGLVFRRQTIRNWIRLAFLFLVELGMVALFLAALRNLLAGEWDVMESLGSLCTSVSVGGLIGAGIFVLVRALGMPQASFDVHAQVLHIGQGQSLWHVPFADISQVTVRVIQRGATEAPETRVIEIGVILENGRHVPLGTVSGKAEKTAERAMNIAQWIEDLTGAQTE